MDIGTDCPVCESARYVAGRCRRCGYDKSRSPVPTRPTLEIGINKLSLQPGDIVAATISSMATQEQYAMAEDFLAKAFKPFNVTVILLTDQLQLSILRAAKRLEPIEPETDHATVVEVKT